MQGGGLRWDSGEGRLVMHAPREAEDVGEQGHSLVEVSVVVSLLVSAL